MTHRSGALSFPLSHEQQESVDVTFFVLVGEGVEEVAEDFGDLVVLDEEAVVPVRSESCESRQRPHDLYR